MGDTFSTSKVLFPYIVKKRVTGSIRSRDTADVRTVSPSILPYSQRAYANPVITTAGVLNMAGLCGRRARRLRQQLYNTVPKSLIIKLEDINYPSDVLKGMQRLELGTSNLIIDIDNMMAIAKAANSSNTSSEQKEAGRQVLTEIERYLWYPNSMVNDVEYCKDARRACMFLISNDIVELSDSTATQVIDSYQVYASADAATGGKSLYDIQVDTGALHNIVSGRSGASAPLLSSVAELEVSLGSHVKGKSFWERDISGITYYAVENEVSFLDKVIQHDGEERAIMSRSGGGDITQRVSNRLSDIRTFIGSRYSYNKVIHAHMDRMRRLNYNMTLIYSALNTSLTDVLGPTWRSSVKGLLEDTDG